MYETPTLLLDEARCRRNLQAMQAKADQHGLRLRPHVKTHQSLTIARWMRELGAEGLTVSSLGMAEYFAAEWDDLTVAFPTNLREIERIRRLASRVRLNLLVESTATARFLQEQLTHPVGIFLAIDVGYHRTGLDPEALTEIEAILAVLDLAPQLTFRGWLAHAGHSYQCHDAACIEATHRSAVAQVRALKGHFAARYPEAIASLGDTPGCSVSEHFEGIDEIRPGNYVFYDLAQQQIGSNTYEQIALAMACPVVALHPRRQEAVLYGGGVHFSKDRLTDAEGHQVWGQVVRRTDNGWGTPIEGMYLRSLSQEHGIVRVPSSEMGNLSIGDYLLVLPVHACMAAACMGEYVTLAGERMGRWRGR